MKKVLIIHPEGNVLNNPSIKALIDLLQNHGISVSIHCQGSPVRMDHASGVILRPWGKIYGRIKRIALDYLASGLVSYALILIELLFVREKYDLIIGVDRQGIIEAYLWWRLTRVPYVFWSFEIMFLAETSVKYKRLEKIASKFASLWFVQDKLRASKLRFENDLANSNCRLVPLASAGVGKFSDKRLRDELGIPKSKKVAMLMGSLSKWTMAFEIINTVDHWTSDWVLVVHDRYGKTDAFMRKINPSSTGFVQSKIFISNKAVDCVDDMGFILSGVTVGLVFYKPTFGSPYTGNNLAFLGLASGKVATYWRYGIPVIMNSIGEYSDITISCCAGVVMSDNLNDLPDILAQHEFSSLGINAKRVFERMLDFDLYRDRVWADLTSVAKVR